MKSFRSETRMAPENCAILRGVRASRCAAAAAAPAPPPPARAARLLGPSAASTEGLWVYVCVCACVCSWGQEGACARGWRGSARSPRRAGVPPVPGRSPPIAPHRNRGWKHWRQPFTLLQLCVWSGGRATEGHNATAHGAARAPRAGAARSQTSSMQPLKGDARVCVSCEKALAKEGMRAAVAASAAAVPRPPPPLPPRAGAGDARADARAATRSWAGRGWRDGGS